MQHPCHPPDAAQLPGSRGAGGESGTRTAIRARQFLPWRPQVGTSPARVVTSLAMPRFLGLVFIAAALIATPALARQDPAPVRKAVEDYLRIQTKGLPGTASFTVGNIDPNNNLVPCPAFEVAQAPGARPWGRTTVTVHCAQQGGWSLFVPVHIRIVADYIVSARGLAQGQVITDSDLARRNGDLSVLPGGVLTDEQQALGRTALMPIPLGRPLRADMLRQAAIVQQGQSVKVISRGPGFEVANEGRALNNAVEGQVVQVRLANGQVISGIARGPGQVVVSF